MWSCSKSCRHKERERERERRKTTSRNPVSGFSRHLQGIYKAHGWIEYTSDVNLSKVFFLLWTRKRSEGAGGNADYHHRQRPRVCSLVSSYPLLLFLKEQIQSCCCKHPAKEYSLTTGVKRNPRPISPSSSYCFLLDRSLKLLGC